MFFAVWIFASCILLVDLAAAGYPWVTQTAGRPWPLPQNEVQGTGSLDFQKQGFS